MKPDVCRLGFLAPRYFYCCSRRYREDSCGGCFGANQQFFWDFMEPDGVLGALGKQYVVCGDHVSVTFLLIYIDFLEMRYPYLVEHKIPKKLLTRRIIAS